ncbi:EAL domain-containing protein [Breznakiella homolactica]|uniref:PTS sugar transporter subunit IIC/EAL domain-containing protein n=1 Tax=Breznakiella homolactica TaxID=2798577 RepID=A0A7T8B9S7_9SPIR|nr:EAL domain-containing protein [Breznakiella homolactica]QQO07503.1 EAL domain-containing protein [Breznakiella homolactica]
MVKRLSGTMFALANQPVIKSIRTGLLYITPFLIIGSMVLAILNFPIPAVQDFLDRSLSIRWREIALAIHQGTLQVMAITALITVSFAVASEHELIKSGEVSPISVIVTVFSSYIAFIHESEAIVSLPNAGSTALFVTLLVAVLGTRLFLFLYRLRDRLVPVNPLNYNGNIFVRLTFRVILPAFLTILTFTLAEAVLNATGIWDFIGRFPSHFYGFLLSQSNYLSVLILVVITHLFWLIGIHGGNFVMDAIPDIVIEIGSRAGGTGEIFMKRMLDTFVHLGGAGATFGLLIALLLVGRKHNENLLAKSSLFPGLFNINESIIFGLPVIFSPYYLIPFITIPVVISAISYFAFWTGIVPPMVNDVGWTTPVFLSGYLSTGSIAGAVLQGINLTISITGYIPFIRMQQKDQDKRRLVVMKQLNTEIQNVTEIKKNVILTRYDEVGALGRELAEEIKQDLLGSAKLLHIEYQPKVDYNKRVLGAEALLRCNHPFYGNISPLVILSLAEDVGLMNKLGSWCINQAFKDLAEWNKEGFTTISVSANLNPKQLQEDEHLIQTIQNCITSNNIDPKYMELELTENAAVDPNVLSRTKLEQIRAMGIDISIDDFGMGHSSLLYLVDSYASIVKIDRALVSDIARDKDRRQIVQSIITLCSELNVKVIAEGVEEIEQIDILEELGCRYYQGFYFSKSLKSEDFLKFVREHGTIE